jgi:hypothetical protein
MAKKLQEQQRKGPPASTSKTLSYKLSEGRGATNQDVGDVADKITRAPKKRSSDLGALR